MTWDSPRTHRPGSRGFTLIEVLAVVVIVGLLLTFATLSVGTNQDETVQTEAKRFTALVRLAAEEAILSTRELGIRLDRGGYTFVGLTSEGWVPLEDTEGIYRPRELPAEVVIDGELNGEPLVFADVREPDDDQGGEGEVTQGPTIFLFSSGEMTPFLIEFTVDFGPVYQVSGDYTGKVTYLGLAEKP